MALNYDYTASKAYCEQIGLYWMGEQFLLAPDADAKALNFTQEQVDAAMRHHLWQIKYLFTPKNYGLAGRIKLALFFLTGIGGKK